MTVAGSASLYPALAFEDVLAESSEGPFMAQAPSGLWPLWAENRAQSLVLPLGCLPPRRALTEARVKSVEIAPAAAFPNPV